MANSPPEPIDLVDELRLRSWARLHHVAVTERDARWHAIILDEMQRKDAELLRSPCDGVRSNYVPLVPSTSEICAHAAHEVAGPHFQAGVRAAELFYA